MKQQKKVPTTCCRCGGMNLVPVSSCRVQLLLRDTKDAGGIPLLDVAIGDTINEKPNALGVGSRWSCLDCGLDGADEAAHLHEAAEIAELIAAGRVFDTIDMAREYATNQCHGANAVMIERIAQALLAL